MTGAGSPLDRDPLREARRLLRAGEFRRAVDGLEQMPVEQRTRPDWLLSWAMGTWRIGRFAESRDAAIAALAGYEANADSDGAMRAGNVAAAGELALGRLGQARLGFQQAFELATLRRDELMTARCANNLGSVAYYLGDLDAASRQYAKAGALFEQIRSLYGVAEATHNLATVHRERMELEKARAATDRALEVAEEMRDGRVLGWVLGGRGETDALMGDLRLGRVKVERSLDLARQHDDPLTEVESLKVLAFIHRRMGDVDTAVSYARRAVEEAERAGHPWTLARANHELGETRVSTGQLDLATEAFRTAADAYRRVGAERRADALQRRSEVPRA